MVVGTYLLKDESKTDSHLECEVTILPGTSPQKTSRHIIKSYSKQKLNKRNLVCFFLSLYFFLSNRLHM